MTNNIFKNTTLDILRSLDDSPTMRAIRAMEDSATVRMMRDINNSPSLRIMRDLENTPILKIIKDLENSSAFKAIRELQDSPALRAIKALEVSPSITAFSRISEQLNQNYGALTFSEAYQLIVDEMPEAEDDASLIEMVQDKSNRAPLSPLSAEFYLSLIFALFLYYLSQMSATESEERLIERMGVLEQTITTQLNVLQSKEIGHVFLVTDRELNLREGPGMDNEVIEVLPRNKKIIELKRSKEWVQIEYFDYINNVSKVGWVHSGYLMVVDSKDKK